MVLKVQLCTLLFIFMVEQPYKRCTHDVNTPVTRKVVLMHLFLEFMIANKPTDHYWNFNLNQVLWFGLGGAV